MFNKAYSKFFHTKDGTRIFYQTNFEKEELKSSKPLIVFNYGLVCSNSHWKFQIPFFESLGYNILIHDYRSHFASSGEDKIELCTFKNISSDIHEIITYLGAKKVIMIGHSMGVNVTLEYAKNYPAKLSGLVLISGSVLPPHDVMFDSNIMDLISPAIEWVSKNHSDTFQKIWKTQYLNPITRKLIHSGGFNVKHVEEGFIQMYLKKIGELPQEIFLHLLEEMKKHDIINHLENITIPSLIIGGDKDKVIPNHLQQILKKYLINSQLYIVKDGSHVPQVDFPDFLNERIEAFIKNIN